jgi:dipeptidyl aminopeptidase/acylaminoacyl peptidase
MNPERGYKKTELFRIDLVSGSVKNLVTETSATNIDNFNYWLAEKAGMVIFSSERSGWRQLYRYLINEERIEPLTEGDFFVNDVVHINTEKKRLYFVASGREPGRNPYHQHLYSISLNGGNPAFLTPENAHHQVSFSPCNSYFVDQISTAQKPPRMVLCESQSGHPVLEVARADIEGLLETGWKPPDIFEAVARDGQTTLYGALWKPTHFDPSVKYPVIDHSYTGPHTQMFPKDFRRVVSLENQSIAELGFIVIMVDGMGSSGRSKAFHDVSYKQMGFNLTDHMLAIQQLGRKYQWIDTNRVGIFGHSAGGYDAGHAVLQFPDFYKVAVASSADHDHRMEKAWWPEMYMGWPVDSAYHLQSNITMAPNLKGKLLLVHGGLDDNVNPSATFKLAEALVKADKEFDLLIFPSQRHGYRGEFRRYFMKKRWNYFIEHLLGAEPVWEIDFGD